MHKMWGRRLMAIEFPPIEDIDTSFGFRWRGIEVERLATIRDRAILGIRVNKTSLQIYVSPTGRSVRVWKNGKELT
jgi:hypothetical protein